mmetsp:Transcript_82485/g.229979  ORF Transcript_82485/g.229979 Transcript_82485/m.229979 type:complete len:530 (+) Transcript_82485:76-1665(+)|eukprot:CAMPEP_0117475890 /NCGR_PEP_ID=MMETSP0784-20121206/10029_1 /TAXON_ID=39447 /ORGANISM="" /LENGTH=529 /DNA_ID=CAMNT_0005270153 /DNA_START=76 /DNA_END=1665 /DNA_ORIENTATION=+
MQNGLQAPKAVPGPSLAFEGGGIRSLSMFAGLTAGLMNVANTSDTPPTLLGTGIYAKFTSLASVSGGSWFAAELIYADRFLKLVEDMAAEPKCAAFKYGRRWTDPWLSVAHEDSPFVKAFAALAAAVGAVGMADDLLLAGYFWKKGLTWTAWTLTMLETTAGLDMSCTLGSPVMDWAQGKVWLVCHALVAPSNQDETPVLIHEHRRSAIKQTMQGSPSLAVYVPATYSFVLGSRCKSAPVTYVAESAVPKSAKWVYTGSNAQCAWMCSSNLYAAKSKSVGTFDNFVDDASSLPVVNCVAASSAGVGKLVLSDVAANIMYDVSGSLAVWQGSGVGQDAFTKAERLVLGLGKSGRVSQEAVEELAASAVSAAIDAGVSDTTGIAYAVAAGSTDVVAYLDFANPKHLANLFTGHYEVDGATGENPLPVFQEGASGILSEYAAFAALQLTPGAKFLTAISVGTLQATTAENKLWGITAGISVTVHVIAVAGAVTMGWLQNVHDYDVLAQEVIETVILEENSALMRETVMPWFI